MGKGGVAVAAQKKRDESYTVAEEAPSGSLKRVSRHSQAIQPGGHVPKLGALPLEPSGFDGAKGFADVARFSETLTS